jgi:ribosomal protein S18 acetylase RimI-like enzyme
MSPHIRVLGIADAAALFELRRQALRDAPSAFLASPEDDLASSEDTVRQLLARAPESVVFGALTENLVGMLGLNRGNQIKSAHKVHLWGMFVIPQWRRQGLGERLLHAAIAHARATEGITSMRLSVSESAIAAKRLYERVGFRAWGVEPDAIRYQALSLADHHMALALGS